MEIFNHNALIKSWGSVYLGLKKGWLTGHELLDYCEQKKIANCSDADFVDLYLALEESLHLFLEKIKGLTIKYDKVRIDHSEDEVDVDIYLPYIPAQFWHFWEIEFLSRIVQSNGGKEKALQHVASIHSELNFPAEWNDFMYFVSSENGAPKGIDALYQQMLDYIKTGLKAYQEVEQ